MPHYDFECAICGRIEEQSYRMSQVPAAILCRDCGAGAVRRLAAGVASTKNCGSPDRRERARQERIFGTMSAQTPNERLGIDPREGVVRRGKKPRDKRRIQATVP